MMEESRLIVSASPHIKDKDTIPRIMWTVVASLLPAIIAGTYFFGLRVLLLVLVSSASAVATEAIIQKATHKLFGKKLEQKGFKGAPPPCKRIAVSDGSAVVTGVLLAMVIPPGVPLWMPVIGAFCSIAFAKAPFGGLGYNIFNPALIGRAILLASFPVAMTTWNLPIPLQTVDSVTGATPLELIKQGNLEHLPSIWNLFIGMSGGSAGETSELAILIGAAVLLVRGYITWHIPISFVCTVAGVVGLQQLFGDQNFIMIPFHIFSGGLFLGAFFMATDMVTSPLTKKGGVIFGIGAGMITCVIRILGGYPEGVCYSILLMNAFTPLIDRYVKPRRLGR